MTPSPNYTIELDFYGDGEKCYVVPEKDYAALVAALQAILKRYVGLVNSGDAGFWNPEKEPEVMQARTALALARGETKSDVSDDAGHQGDWR